MSSGPGQPKPLNPNHSQYPQNAQAKFEEAAAFVVRAEAALAAAESDADRATALQRLTAARRWRDHAEAEADTANGRTNARIASGVPLPSINDHDLVAMRLPFPPEPQPDPTRRRDAEIAASPPPPRTTLVRNASIWQWSAEALSGGPAAMLRAADAGRAGTAEDASWLEFDADTGEITAVGDRIRAPYPPAHVVARAARVVNMGGRLLLPGLQDAHIHLYMCGATASQVQLSGCPTIQELRRRVATHAAAHPAHSRG